MNFFFNINKKLCIPEPLPEEEVKSIWESALHYINSNPIKKDKSTHSNNQEKNRLIKEASEQILSKYSFATIEETKDILYYKDGVYVKSGDTLIEKETEILFGYDIKTLSKMPSLRP